MEYSPISDRVCVSLPREWFLEIKRMMTLHAWFIFNLHTRTRLCLHNIPLT